MHEEQWRRAHIGFIDTEVGMADRLVRLRDGWIDILVEEADGGDPAVLKTYPASRIQFVNWQGTPAGDALSQGHSPRFMEADVWADILARFDWDECSGPQAVTRADFLSRFRRIASGVDDSIALGNFYNHDGLEVQVVVRAL